MNVAGTIKDILESVRDRAVMLAKDGKLPGYEIRQGNEITEIEDVNGFYNAIKDHVTKDELMNSVSLTKGPIEVIFKERYSKAMDCTKKQAGIYFDEVVKQFGKTKRQADRLVKVKQKQLDE